MMPAKSGGKVMPSSFKRCGLNVGRVVSLAILPVCAILLTVQAQQPQTVKQGVYTDNQARRGQATYKDRCSSCHGEKLEGRLGPPLTGEDFIYDWAKQPLRSEEHTSELQSLTNLVCRLLLEKK